MEKFWNKYIESDTLERMEQLTPVIKRIEEGINALNESYNESDTDGLFLQGMKAQLIQSYFDDLIEVMESRK